MAGMGSFPSLNEFTLHEYDYHDSLDDGFSDLLSLKLPYEDDDDGHEEHEGSHEVGV
jgi:hypothetical protein